MRDRFELQIARMQPEPQASLLTGLLTGSRGGMPQDLLDAFRTAGLSHIVAISGYNITIIITLVGGMLFTGLAIYAAHRTTAPAASPVPAQPVSARGDQPGYSPSY
jgi:competence protein ComEC